VAKKVPKIAEASDLRPKHGPRHKPSAPLWGKAGPPPAPTISPAPPQDRTARQCRAFITDTGQPSPLLAELMRAPATAPPLSGEKPILEAGALACRRRNNGEVSILLISKSRSGKWSIPKGRLDGRLTFGEVVAKEAFEEAGIKGYVSPNSIGMYRVKKRTQSREHTQVVEVWVYLMEITKRVRHWPEEGKREVRWVSCETAARELREPILADICHRLANG
jgi:8-oxo-dGTP pyrophosphatase MutT (NUDIX family)